MDDFKYGLGVQVFAYENPQLAQYALGVLDELDADGAVNTIHIRIAQPRLGHYDTWTVDRVGLVDFGLALKAKLERLPGVAEVRGYGLLLAAELAEGRDSKQVYDALLQRGLVTNAVTSSALRLAPPLTVSGAEIDEAVALIGEVLE